MTGPLLFSIVVLTIAFSPAGALRCWDCSSDKDIQCADPFNSSFIWQDECKPEPPHDPNLQDPPPTRFPVCKKVKQLEYGRLVYIRSCGLEAWHGGACSPEGHAVLTCHTCNTDGCNVAAVSTSSGTMFVLSLLATVIFYAPNWLTQ